MIVKEMKIKTISDSTVVFIAYASIKGFEQLDTIEFRMSRERWEKEFKEQTRCTVCITFPSEEPKDV